jgi:hypothetical protein
MRLLLSIWFAVVMLAANLHQSASFAFFKANEKAIINEHCEMRELDNNSCQGSCVLRDLLEPDNHKEELPFSVPDLNLDEFLSTTNTSLKLENVKVVREAISLYCKPLLDQSLICKIWRPPQVIA